MKLFFELWANLNQTWLWWYICFLFQKCNLTVLPLIQKWKNGFKTVKFEDIISCTFRHNFQIIRFYQFCCLNKSYSINKTSMNDLSCWMDYENKLRIHRLYQCLHICLVYRVILHHMGFLKTSIVLCFQVYYPLQG